ncbi:MAG: class I SAM-dependent methyltransferase [Deltaproteobacteria bacterium]|nr:class I SAM-dependent methyltransferase [Deltaproteobacteria bacterium]
MLKLKTAVLFLSLVAPRSLVWAQDSIPYVPSPIEVVNRMLAVAELTTGDVLYDMGSGDGRIVIQAAKKYGVRGVGIDLNAALVERAKQNAIQEGVSHLVQFRAADGLTVDISEATVVTLYMFKWFNNQLRPKLQKLKPGSRVVAHDFDIDDWKPTKVEYIEPTAESSADFSEPRMLYIWKIQPPAAP